jgi:hypothetical protein
VRAIFVPDGADNARGGGTTHLVGPDPIAIRVAWVPADTALPGYPYEDIGGAVFEPDEGNGVRLDSSDHPTTGPGNGVPRRAAPSIPAGSSSNEGWLDVPASGLAGEARHSPAQQAGMPISTPEEAVQMAIRALGVAPDPGFLTVLPSWQCRPMRGRGDVSN